MRRASEQNPVAVQTWRETVKGCVTEGEFTDFLRYLLHETKRPVYLIVDGHPAHRAAPERRFVEGTPAGHGRLRKAPFGSPVMSRLIRLMPVSGRPVPRVNPGIRR
ncbi:MAG: hypothetical protein ACE15F_25050, partial [bacterium]